MSSHRLLLVTVVLLLLVIMGAATQASQAPASSATTTDAAAPEPGSAMLTGPYKVGGSVLPPKLVKSPDPKYPKQARKAKLQGTVLLWLVVDEQGRPRDIKISRSLDPRMDESAAAAVRKWKFKPATKDGKPVAVQINVEVNYHLY